MTDRTFNRLYLAACLAVSAALWALCLWIIIS
jgi:hypothetical protein